MNIHSLATEMRGIIPGTEVVVVINGKEYTDLRVRVMLKDGTFRYRFEIYNDRYNGKVKE